ncbi:bifunctional diaminohydroxyphosphoribosylaminopyrimidine deaminase/5-amino-6-(5-phosphoribosylamino)uracil reductase RibD, partial [Methylocystis sp. 9N]
GGRPHAEAIALAAAGEAARGATLYVTLEPCAHHGATPPCVDAIIAGGIARVVTAMEDPDPRVSGDGHARLREAGIEVVVGVEAAAARADHLGHILRVTRRRPMVTLKLAQTADGYAAGAAHDPRLHITGPVADAFTHVQRSLHDAIMVGAGTVREDDPLMTVRLPGLQDCKPLRIVLDRRLTLSPRSRLASTARETPLLIIVGDETTDDAARAFEEATGAEVARVATRDGRLDLGAALRLLADRGMTRVFSEGGPRVAESLLMGNLADEVILHKGVKPLGRQGRLALTPAARAALEDDARYRIIETRSLGADTMTRYAKVG